MKACVRASALQDPPTGSPRPGGQHTRDIFVHKDAVQASGKHFQKHSTVGVAEC